MALRSPTWRGASKPGGEYKPVAQGQDYTLYQFIRPGKASCSYGLISGKEMMLFDPSRNIDFYLDFAAEHGCIITKTFETHLQADYISGSRDISRHRPARFSMPMTATSKPQKIPIPLCMMAEALGFSIGGPKVRVLFTPGHTPVPPRILSTSGLSFPAT